jgi:hypothetical protein
MLVVTVVAIIVVSTTVLMFVRYGSGCGVRRRRCGVALVRASCVIGVSRMVLVIVWRMGVATHRPAQIYGKPHGDPVLLSMYDRLLSAG